MECITMIWGSTMVIGAVLTMGISMVIIMVVVMLQNAKYNAWSWFILFLSVFTAC